MITDNFTNIPSNASVVEYVFAFENALGGVAMFSFLWAIVIILGVSVYSWKRDWVDSILYASILGIFMGFLMTLISSQISLGQSLLSFAHLSTFIILAVLLTFYKKWSDG